MRRKLFFLLLSLLILICILAGIHIIVDSSLHREEKLLFLQSLCPSARGVSENIPYLSAKDSEIFIASVSGVKGYMDMLVEEIKVAEYYSYSYRYNILVWKNSFLNGINHGYITMLHVKDRVEGILDRLVAGAPEAGDYAYLNRLESSLNLLLGSLQNADGSINRKSINKDYATKRINEFLEAIA